MVIVSFTVMLQSCRSANTVQSVIFEVYQIEGTVTPVMKLVSITRKAAWPANGDKIQRTKRPIPIVPSFGKAKRLIRVLAKDLLPMRNSSVFNAWY